MSDRSLLEARPWLRYYAPGVPHTVAYPDRPLQHLLDEAAGRYPDRPAITFFNRDLSYRALQALVDRFAGGLRELGLRPGDRVSLHLPNCPQFVIAFFATLKAGGVVVPFNPLYTEHEVARQMADCGAVIAVTLDLFLAQVRAARGRTALRGVIVTRINEFFPPLLRRLYPLRARRHRQWPEIALDETTHLFDRVARGQAIAGPARPAPDDLAVLLYTGGTTGTPKGAMLTHRNLVANVYQASAWVPDPAPMPTAVAALPLFHSYGLTAIMNLTLLHAGRLVLLPRYETKAVLKAIARHRPERFGGVPTMFSAMAAHPGVGRYSLRSIRACTSGAAALPAEVQSRFERATGVKVIEGYGLSEASPITHITPLEGLQKPGSIGVPVPDTDARIVDIEDGARTLPPGEIGELAIRGPQVMAGYWKRPEETAQALRDGWLFTGDIAQIDEDGFFYIIDRKKEMLITGGFNVYPREIEEVLYGHPAVLEAALIGVPDPHKGEVGKAFVALRPDARATADDLLAHCRRHLAPYKVPSSIEFRETLPKSLIGKVLRRVLADEERRGRA